MYTISTGNPFIYGCCEDTKNMNYLKLHNKIDFKLHIIQKTATISFKKNEIDNFRV